MSTRRLVDFSGSSSTKEDKAALLSRLRSERDARATYAVETKHAAMIQRNDRSWLRVRRAANELRRDWESRWTSYTALLNQRAATLKEHPEFSQDLFPAEGPLLIRLISLLALGWKRKVRKEEQSKDGMKLLSICAAIVKSNSDKAPGSERHGLFWICNEKNSSATPTSASASNSASPLVTTQTWLAASSSLVHLLLLRLYYYSSSSISDPKSYALLLGVLGIMVDAGKWNTGGPTMVEASASPPSTATAASSPPLSPSTLSLYSSFLERIIYDVRFFSRMKELLVKLAWPGPVIKTNSAASSSASSTSAPTSPPPRPLPFLHSLLSSCTRILELTLSYPSVRSEAKFLFAAEIETLPAVKELCNPTSLSVLIRPNIQAELRFAFGRMIRPELFPMREETPEQWHRLQALLPDYLRTNLSDFSPTDLHCNLPPCAWILGNLVAGMEGEKCAPTDHTQFRQWCNLLATLLSELPREVLLLDKNGKWELGGLEESEFEVFKNRFGEVKQDAQSMATRKALLKNLASFLSQTVLTNVVNTVFCAGFDAYSEEKTKQEEEKLLAALPNSAGEKRKQFEKRLQSFGVLESPASESRFFLQIAQYSVSSNPQLFDSVVELVREWIRLRNAANQVYAWHSSPLLAQNPLSFLSFSSPFLILCWTELQRRIGVELNEEQWREGAGGEAGGKGSHSANHGAEKEKTSTTSLLREFFGFHKKSAAKSASAVNMEFTNRNRWEHALLTSRHAAASSASSSIVTVTDLFQVWLSLFLPLLFVVGDEELLEKLPGFPPPAAAAAVRTEEAEAESEQRRHMFISFVNLVKMLVFRLLWNQYSKQGALIPFKRYQDLLEPSRVLLKELYQRDVRYRFMRTKEEMEEERSRRRRKQRESAVLSGKVGNKQQGGNGYSAIPSTGVEMETYASSSSSSTTSLPSSFLPSSPSVDVHVSSSSWLLSSSSEGAVEIAQFQEEFEAWATGGGGGGGSGDNDSIPGVDTARLFHLLTDLPFILPFERRVSLLRAWIRADSWNFGYRPAGQQQVLPRYEVSIRRQHLVQDGLYAISKLGRGFKHRLRVKFVDDSGEEEKGIDLGGLSKELIEGMCKEIVRVDYGLFTRTPPRAEGGGQEYYPNPNAVEIHPNTYYTLLQTLGRIVGKALYEGILLDIPLASFFLNRFIDQGSVLSDLKALDEDLYRNLLIVKNYPGDIQDLGLFFTVDTEVMGRKDSIELIPGGREVEVTNSNRILYVYKFASYHLNTKLQPVMEPFMQGFREIIDTRWLRLFNTVEMRMLLSGSTIHEIDVVDWKAHTHYEECSSSTRVCVWFWELLQERFTKQEKEMLLKFTTSCSRPPLQGFRELQPPFTLRVIPVIESSSSSSSSKGFFSKLFSSKPNQAQLPSAATCFNMLKLPKYSSKSVLEEKLRLAIQNNTGFHLT